MPGYVHHLQWSVTDVLRTITTLTRHWAGTIIARRQEEIVIKLGDALILVSNKNRSKVCNTETDYPYLNCCHGSSCPHFDSVFNICLEVENVQQVCKRMEKRGSRVLMSPKTVKNDHGQVTMAVVSSPCDNVIHSLVNTSQYHGTFLPGFQDGSKTNEYPHEDNLRMGNEAKETGLTFIDHITYVCRPGESRQILDWYSDTCGMTRFKLSPTEDDQGVAIEGEAALRLKVGEWMSEWMCREIGVTNESDQRDNKRNFKLVLAEPLSDTCQGHVNKFLELFPGPGVQHIGICSDDIQKTVSILSSNGAQFRNPPPAYYNLVQKRNEFTASKFDHKLCKNLGILIDKEEQFDDLNEEKFLLQIFTKPIFNIDTFFMEVIQRKGALGFGAGNIKALALSIVLQNDLKVGVEI